MIYNTFVLLTENKLLRFGVDSPTVSRLLWNINRHTFPDRKSALANVLTVRALVTILYKICSGSRKLTIEDNSVSKSSSSSDRKRAKPMHSQSVSSRG